MSKSDVRKLSESNVTLEVKCQIFFENRCYFALANISEDKSDVRW